MAKRFTQKRPKLVSKGGMSPMPVVFATKEAVKSSDTVSKWKKRRKRGMELTLLAAAKILIEDIQKNAPTIGDYDYSKDLSVALVQKGKEPVVAIAFKQKSRPLDAKDLSSTVLYVRTGRKSSMIAKTLQRYAPWPAELMPTKLQPKDATVIAKRVSKQEIDKLTTRMIARRAEIEGKLRAAGLPGVVLKRGTGGLGGTVQDDVGFAVLRKELGIKTKREAHWKPALKRLPKRLDDLKKMFIEFMMTGKESAFELPDIGEETLDQVKAGSWFSD